MRGKKSRATLSAVALFAKTAPERRLHKLSSGRIDRHNLSPATWHERAARSPLHTRLLLRPVGATNLGFSSRLL